MIEFKILSKDNSIQNLSDINESLEIKFALNNLYSKFETNKKVLHLFYMSDWDLDKSPILYDLSEYDLVFVDFSASDYLLRYFDIDKLLNCIKAKEVICITKNPIERKDSLYIDPLMFRIADLNFEYSFENKTNDYFYFGGHGRYHRLKFLSILKDLNSLNRISWSQRAVSDEDHFRDIIPYEYKDTYKELSIHTDLPKILDIPIVNNDEYHAHFNDNWITENAGVKPNLEFPITHFAEIISESVFYYSINPTKADNTFLNFSEKTFKPLSLGIPFIGLMLPNSFNKMKEYGFKLFDEIFDYSFDSIIDDDTRMESIVKQIANNNISEKILNNKESILEKHNYNKNRFKEFKKEMLLKYEKSLLR